MYNILICEDEPLIAKGLEKIIRGFELPVDRIYLAENGRQALETIRANPTQIVLTDVEMPGLNGLEFLKKMREIQPAIQAIIISGFSNFSYAQLAIKLGVSDYLLKPVDKQELLKALNHSMQVIEQQQTHRRLLPQVLYSQLKSVWPGFIGENTLHQLEQTPNLESLDSHPLYLTFHIEHPGRVSSAVTCRLVETSLQKRGHNCLLLSLSPHSFLILLCAEPGSVPSVAAYMKDLLADILQERGIRLFCGISEPADDFLQLSAAAKDAECALCTRFFPKTPPVIFPGGQQLSSSQKKHLDKLTYDLVKNLRACSPTEISENLGRYFDFLRDLPADSRQCCLPAFQALAEQLKDAFPPIDGEAAGQESLLLPIVRLIECSDSLSELQQAIREVLAQWCEHRSEILKSRDVVSRAISYIEENYAKSINLSTLSNTFSMNYTYFSDIFKKKTGISLTTYLQKARIEASKEILTNTDVKIYEAAHRVGIPDENYFVKLFKKFENVTPTEFRYNLPSPAKKKPRLK